MLQFLKKQVKKHFSVFIYRKARSAAARNALDRFLAQLGPEQPMPLHRASFDLFTYHGEDGIIAWLTSRLTGLPKRFVDIGAGDCIRSNCARLAVHEGWQGVFADASAEQLDTGKRFYRKTGISGLQFINRYITPVNVNRMLEEAGMTGEIGLLSVDIDGNDFWVWEALTVLQPRIVVIEAKVEFGLENRVVPYGPANHREENSRYNGASVEALRLLGWRKGYKLVGANKEGYNLFFVQEKEILLPVTAGEILADPAIQDCFYPPDFFNEYQFEKA